MRVHVLQHVPFEDTGSMAPWLAERGAVVTCTRFFLDPVLPPAEGLDLVIAMGGLMSVNDEDRLPWLVPEKRFLRDAIERGVRVIGVCLGAQLIASALGASIRRNPHREIGWFPVEAAPAVAPGLFRFPDRCTVFHWHGETFDLPPGAVRLAGSVACANQAFALGRTVLGLQFHLETTPDGVRDLVGHCRDELTPGPYVQTEAELLGAPPSAYARANALMADFLAHLLAPAG